MISRPISDSGDMVPVVSDSQLITGKEAVLIAIGSRLNLLYGEWWEDETLGFKIPTFLFDGIRVKDKTMLGGYITAYIENTDEVESVKNVEIEKEKSKLIYKCVVQTENESFEGEVDERVLLRSVY